MLGALYVCLLGLLLVAARRLPTRGALLEKAHLADQPLLMKLPRNITELQEVRASAKLGPIAQEPPAAERCYCSTQTCHIGHARWCACAYTCTLHTVQVCCGSLRPGAAHAGAVPDQLWRAGGQPAAGHVPGAAGAEHPRHAVHQSAHWCAARCAACEHAACWCRGMWAARNGALARHHEAVRLKPEDPHAHRGDANQVGCPAGSMYPFLPALFTVAVVSTAGACLNYELSARLVRDMVVDLMPGKLSFFHRSVSRHQENLLSYFVFLRVRPPFHRVCLALLLQNCDTDLISGESDFEYATRAAAGCGTIVILALDDRQMCCPPEPHEMLVTAGDAAAAVLVYQLRRSDREHPIQHLCTGDIDWSAADELHLGVCRSHTGTPADVF